MQSEVVALVLAPQSAEIIEQILAGTPAWIVSTPEMQATLAVAKRSRLQVTELHPNGSTPTEWIFNHLDSVDQHHNELSQSPGYTTLLVFGVPLSPSLPPFLAEFGFLSPRREPFGFSARKLGQA